MSTRLFGWTRKLVRLLSLRDLPGWNIFREQLPVQHALERASVPRMGRTMLFSMLLGGAVLMGLLPVTTPMTGWKGLLLILWVGLVLVVWHLASAYMPR
jgi:hypothetical protein